MRSRRKWLTLTTGFVATAVAGAVLAAAPPTQQAPQPPVFGVGVTLVAVPVFVTDKAGKSVAGLTADDFEIEEGGKPVPIASFQAIDVVTPRAGERAELPTAMGDMPLAMRAVAPRQFLLLVDRVFSPPGGLFFGRKAAGDFIREALAPGDLVAVAAWGSNGLKVLSNFTTDHEAAARAVDGKGLAGSTSADPLGLSGGSGYFGGFGIAGVAPTGSGGNPAAGGSGDDAEGELAAQDALMREADEASYRSAATAFIGDLSALVRLLAPLRGRKQIVLLSSGFAEWAWTTPASRGNRGEGEPLQDRLNKVFKEAGQADVVIHTITLDGIDAAIDVGQVQTRSIDATGPPTYSDPSAVRGVFKQDSGRGTLMNIAKNTGGRFILPTGDFGKALGEVDQISRHSYVLAFETMEADGKNDRPRSLKVRVKKPGLSVSHRPEYTPAPAKATLKGSVQMLAAEAISKGLSGGPLRLHLRTLPYRDTEGNASVHAVLQVDGPALTEASRGKDLAIQVYGYAMDDGRVVDGIALNTSIDLARFGPAVRGSGLSVVTAFPVPPGNVDLRFFVRAGGSDLTGSIQRQIAVPSFTAGSRVLSEPMFIVPPAGRLVVPFQPQNRRQIRIPFHVGDSGFLPDVTVTLNPGVAREACVFVWRDRTGSTSPFVVSAELLRSGEAPHALPQSGAPRVIQDQDGFDRYVVTLVPPRVAPGVYTLRLTFSDPGTGQSTRTETEVVVGA